MKFRFILTVLCTGVLTVFGGASTLEEVFKNPPVLARPYVWWHWMGPNFSKEGITRDLEAMKAAGIGGATIFNIASAVQESHAPTENNPWPEQTYRSPAYWEALRHAAAEADRLGLEIGLHNTVGYSTTGGPWVDEIKGMQKVVWKSTDIEGGKLISVELPKPDQPRYSGWGSTGQRSVYYQDIGVVALPSGDGPVKSEAIIDLTNRFKNGKLEWEAPAGQWTVIRLGHAPTGTNPHPLPDDLIGKALEIDKMSAEQSRFHWAQVIDPIKEHLGPYLGKSFRHFLIDSYEAGHQSWTPGFREEFTKRKGYDPLPWMASLAPSVTGGAKALRIIGSEELTSRFEWDYQDVINRLYFENGWQIGKTVVESVGCKLQFEPYGGPFDTVEGAALADLPMGEFWTGGKGGISSSVVAAGRAAGRTVIGAEAFTGRPEVSQWKETPGFLKLSADGSYGAGVNRMILHHWVHQPFSDKYQPGMGMGWWGTHLGRNQTWFEPGKAFFLYLGRVQAMLQWGETPSDFVSVGSVQGGGDAISWDAFRKEVMVRDGKIVLPSGRTYRFLSIPHSKAMLPSDVRQVGELLAQGAAIVCGRPVRSPSLTDYPKCDRDVTQMTERIWGSDNQQQVRTVGKGKLYVSGDVREAMKDLGIHPAFEIRSADSGDIRIQHRSDGTADIFFVANVNDSPQKVTVSFRVADRRPELWDAQAGTIAPAGVWRQRNGRTEVDLDLGAVKSVCVVFRDGMMPKDHVVRIKDNKVAVMGLADGGVKIYSAQAIGGEVLFASGKKQAFELTGSQRVEVGGPWAVEFDSPVDTIPGVKMETLMSLSEHTEPSVRYFAGTATYRNTFKLDAVPTSGRVMLDLGKVYDMAKVTVNGQALGVVWHEPFVVDVSSAAKPGQNTLEIAVTNTWHNRLVGDEQEPADFEWGQDRGPAMGRAMKAYPEWFLKDQPRPSQGRKGFVIWYYHRADTPLIPAGLVGPVQIRVENGQIISSALQ